MAQSDSSNNSIPTIKIRLRGCDDESSFLQHVLERFTTGGLRLRTKAEPAIGSKLRVAYQLSNGETIFHALCLVTQIGQPRDGRRTLELRFKKMSRDSKRIYDRIMAARQILTRGSQPEDTVDRSPRITQVPPRNAPKTQPLPEEELRSRNSMPTPRSGVATIPANGSSAAGVADIGVRDEPTDENPIIESAEPTTHEAEPPEPVHRRRGRRLTTEEVLQLEDDEIMEVEREQPSSVTPKPVDPVFGEFDLFAGEDIGLGEDSILSETSLSDDDDDDHTGDELADAQIISETDLFEVSDAQTQQTPSSAESERDDSSPLPDTDLLDSSDQHDTLNGSDSDVSEQPSADDDDDALIVGEADIMGDADFDNEDDDDALIVGEADIMGDADFDNEDADDALIVAEADIMGDADFDNEDDDDALIVGEADIAAQIDASSQNRDTESNAVKDEDAPEAAIAPLDTEDEDAEDDAMSELTAMDVLGSEFDGSFDDTFDNMFEEMSAESFAGSDDDIASPGTEELGANAIDDEGIHRAATEETDAVYGRPEGVEATEPPGQSDAFDIVRDAFEFASSDVKSFSSDRRDPATLRLASASYQAIPDDSEDAAPDTSEAAKPSPPPIRESRPSDAYDIVRDAFDFASSESSEFETVRDPKRLHLASAAYQAITDEEIANHREEEEKEGERSSEDQEREALEALSSQKERKGPRPIVGPAVRKKKKGFFDRIFSGDD